MPDKAGIVGSELPEWAVPYRYHLERLAIPAEPGDWTPDEDIMSWYVNYVFSMVRERTEASRSGLEGVDIFTLRSRLPRAQTLERNGRHGIAVYTGLVAALTGIVKTAVALETFRTELLLQGEVEDTPDSFFRESLWGDLDVIIPWRVCGEQLFLRCLDFVISHEAAHILLNHLAAAKRSADGLALAGNGFGGWGPKRRTLNRFLELDADAYVTGSWAVEYDASASIADCEGAILFDLIAMVLVFQCFDDGSAMSSITRSNHPSAVHRAMMATSRFTRLLYAGRTGSDKNLLLELSDSAWYRCSTVAEGTRAMRDRWWGSSTRRMGQSALSRLERQYAAWLRPGFAKPPDELITGPSAADEASVDQRDLEDASSA